jgi:hypothetical protein
MWLVSRGLLHIPDPGVLAEFASFQVEYTYLAKVTGKKKYYDRVSLDFWDKAGRTDIYLG